MAKSLTDRAELPRTVDYDPARREILLIDQRLLPHRFRVARIRDYRAAARAIADMTVRGAGAIAACAAFALAQGVQAFRGKDPEAFAAHARKVFRALRDARPTAVDPVNAMRWILGRMETAETVEEAKAAAVAAAREFADAQAAECRNIGAFGEGLIPEGGRVLTHCNAGRLAFVDVGSATAPLYAAWELGRRFEVFCDETRPRSQGAALTAWELARRGIPHWVIADNAAGYFMARGEIDLVIVGADRVVAATGEIANKIGTYSKAVLAKRHGVPFYVAAPFSTLDWELKSGAEIPIEERDPEEVLCAWGATAQGRRARVRVANPDSPARNPAFDVTPADLITGIITPAGVFRPRELRRMRTRLCGPSA